MADLVGKAFLGHRHAATDFLYGDEWLSLASSNSADVRVSFSQTPCDPGEAAARIGGSVKRRCNVALREHGAAVWDALANRGGACFVCGSASSGMTRDVSEALVRIGREHGGLTEDDARKWLRSLELQRSYVVEAY